MYKIQKTNIFTDWFESLKDSKDQKRIMARIDRAELGNLGDVKSVGGGIMEMRFFFGAGYRIYYTIRDNIIILLLCGGDKSSQSADIKYAKEIMRELFESNQKDSQ